MAIKWVALPAAWVYQSVVFAYTYKITVFVALPTSLFVVAWPEFAQEWKKCGNYPHLGWCMTWRVPNSKFYLFCLFRTSKRDEGAQRSELCGDIRGRWGHFECGGRGRWFARCAGLPVDREEPVRRRARAAECATHVARPYRRGTSRDCGTRYCGGWTHLRSVTGRRCQGWQIPIHLQWLLLLLQVLVWSLITSWDDILWWYEIKGYESVKFGSHWRIVEVRNKK